MARTKTTEEFIEEATFVHQKFYDYSKVIYTDAHTKVLIICPVHGEFMQCAGDHIRGTGCPKCNRRGTLAPVAKRRKQTWTKEQAKLRDERSAQFVNDHAAYRLHKASKRRSKQRDIENTLVLSDITIPEVCPYMGTPLTNISGEGRTDTNPSLDRIDSSKGYTKDNIQVVSRIANCMKYTATIEQMLRFAEGVMRVHGPKEYTDFCI